MTGKNIHAYLHQNDVVLGDLLAVTIRMKKGRTGMMIGPLVGFVGNNAITIRYAGRPANILFNTIERIDWEGRR